MNKDLKGGGLARIALAEIPTPKEDAEEIVALIKNRGRISGYQLKSGKQLDKEAAIELARAGGIKGVGIAKRRNSYYLKAIPDGAEGNNLGNLPTTSKNQIL